MKQYKHGEGNPSWNVDSIEGELGWLQNEIFGIQAFCSGKSRKTCSCILDGYKSAISHTTFRALMLDVCIYTSQSLFSTVEHSYSLKCLRNRILQNITKIKEVKKKLIQRLNNCGVSISQQNSGFISLLEMLCPAWFLKSLSD